MGLAGDRDQVVVRLRSVAITSLKQQAVATIGIRQFAADERHPVRMSCQLAIKAGRIETHHSGNEPVTAHLAATLYSGGVVAHPTTRLGVGRAARPPISA